MGSSLFTCGTKRDVFIGTNRPTDDNGGDDGSNGGGSTSPDDNDADGLSNEVERLFDTDDTTADSDEDGFNDGLEFVGQGGDPLNATLAPDPQSRARIIDVSEALQNDPDRDGDGLGDSFERNNGLNPDDPDTDGDGYQDGLELVANSNPFDSESRPTRIAPPASDGGPRTGTPPIDTDRDGLADNIESLNGTDTNDRDSDGDGFSDGIEFLMGSDANSFLSIPNFSVPQPPVSQESSS